MDERRAAVEITRIETFMVPPRWLFCRIETSDGVVGWGEPVVEGSAEVVRTAVHQLGELIMGKDPLRIEDHWQVMTRSTFYRGGAILASAVAGLDQALWDIAGKVRGAPVHELLGGPVRDRVRVYGWVGGDDPAEVADHVGAQVENGFTAVKMNVGAKISPIATQGEVAAAAARTAAARAALGPHGDVALDFHGRVTRPSARRLIEALEPSAPFFVEEPLVPEHTHLMGDLVASTSIPIATGERLYSRTDFLPAVQAGVTVLQPDLCHAGGISEVRRIAALGEPFGALLAPHCPLGPIALAASLQVDFATPNFLIQEQSLGIHYNVGNDLLDYLVDPTVFAFSEGYVARPTAPGLGIEVDEKAVRDADARGHAWRSPLWRMPDGSLSEW